MTRSKSPRGVPGENVAAYYRRRAEGGVGLIVTEGTYVPHPGAGAYPDVPHFYGEESLAGWKRVVDEVHAAGGKIFPQLWHCGLVPGPGGKLNPDAVGPSGLLKPGVQAEGRGGEPMSQAQIDQVVRAFGEAAASAQRLGFDGIEIHGAHGYLVDQFFWDGTNRRTDGYGGASAAERTRFAVEVLREIRSQVSREFPVCLRFSQWKLQDYSARLAQSPQELERFLEPLVAAGVDLFHCSQRRFWEPEFEGTLNLAGWTKKITGRPTITVGSVTLNQEFTRSFGSPDVAGVTGIDELLERLERGEFDLVAVGRSLIVNPAWPEMVRRGALEELRPFQRDVLSELV